MLRTRLIAPLLAAVCLGSATDMFGQDVQVGGRVGLAVSTLSGGDTDYDSELGFAGGVFVGFELSDAIRLYPELVYVSKGGSTGFTGTMVTPDGNLQKITLTETERLDYLELFLPVAFQVALSPATRLRFYGGPSLALELDCTAELKQRVETFSPSGELLDATEQVLTRSSCGVAGEDSPIVLFTDPASFDYGLTFGVGIGVDLAGGSVTADVRYDLGLRDITGGRGGPLRNRAFLFLVGYGRRIGRS